MKQSRYLFILALFVLVFAPMAQAQERVQIRWFVGLGAGTDAPQIEAQQAIADDFNASQDAIELVLEIVDNDSAYDVLATQIAAGNAPDIVGPMGIRGRDAFPGAWLDLTSLIEDNAYDLSDFDPALVEFYNVSGEGQLGLPFAIFPSFLLYNMDLFDEAGIPYPPRNYGDPYIDWDGNEREWNLDTLREIAIYLTVDADGNDPTMDEFNPDNIVQFGYGNQWTDIRGRLTLFAAGNFIDEEGNAVISDEWREGLAWYQEAEWGSYFYPNGLYGGSDLLNGGNWFESGNIAMISIHQWYLPCCLWGLEADWNLAPIPSYNGVTTAKMHADTFGILASTENPQEAFEVLSYLIGDRAVDLTTLYGGMPARLSLQESYFETIQDAEWTEGRGEEIYWDLVVAGMAYPDNPNHEAGLPNSLEAQDRYNAFTQELDNDPTLDLDAAVEALLVDLQAIYDEAGE